MGSQLTRQPPQSSSEGSSSSEYGSEGLSKDQQGKQTEQYLDAGLVHEKGTSGKGCVPVIMREADFEKDSTKLTSVEGSVFSLSQGKD